jgi:hypothetical protein
MKRRDFVTAAATAGLAAVPASAAAGSSIFEMRWFRLRNGSQVQRTADFLSRHFVPAARRAGIGPMGFFSSLIADQGPFVLALASYPSLQAVLDTADRMASDKEFQQGFEEYNAGSELSYMRMENSLLRAFDVQRSIAVPPERKEARIFELRVYESNNARAGKTKVRMFNQGEAGIFQRLGMAPVFFAETIVGRNLPNLTYMVSFNDLADREAKWKAFAGDAEWQKMRAVPEYADALIVSNISNAIVRPLPFSQIR